MVSKPHVPIRISTELRERFAALVDQRGPDECWPWLGRRMPRGYGAISVAQGSDSVNYLAHRLAWVIANGEVPGAKQICHHCDNPPCCNPAHLYAGTAATNAADMVARGRSTKGQGSPMAGRKGAVHPASKYGDDIRVEAVRLFRVERWSAIRVAQHLGCNRQSVARWIRQAGFDGQRRSVPKTPKPEVLVFEVYTKAHSDKAITLYLDQRMPRAAIAREIGCCIQTINRWLASDPRVRERLERVKQTEAYRLYSFGRFKFKEIAAELGCHRSSVARWIKEAQDLLG